MSLHVSLSCKSFFHKLHIILYVYLLFSMYYYHSTSTSLAIGEGMGGGGLNKIHYRCVAIRAFIFLFLVIHKLHIYNAFSPICIINILFLLKAKKCVCVCVGGGGGKQDSLQVNNYMSLILFFYL